jgi:hypothetical protein
MEKLDAASFDELLGNDPFVHQNGRSVASALARMCPVVLG